MATEAPEQSPPKGSRRSFLARASGGAMAVGLAASYGTCAGLGARFLYPEGEGAGAWVFVTTLARLRPGASLTYATPAGATVAIARLGEAGDAADFVALSSVCPHLGCQVHWEAQHDRFFCPCHNGVFDPAGRATGGPPAEAGQSLTRYPLEVRDGALFLRLGPSELAEGPGGVLDPDDPRLAAPRGPGHDPCLAPPTSRGRES